MSTVEEVSTNIKTGIVERVTGSFYRVRFEDDLVRDCVLRGKIRLDDLDSTNPVAVGDRVKVLWNTESYVIQSILSRENYLLRRATKSSAARQILCANVDQVIVIYTIDNPHTPLGFLDNLLVMAGAFHIPACIVLNKIDTLSAKKQEVKARFVGMYRSLGYRVESLSAIDESYHALALDLLRGKRTFIAGRSGSGKSSFINLADRKLNLKTAVVSYANRYGRHTTTFAELFRLQTGGWVIDAPGVREFYLTGLAETEVSHYFPEMLKLLPKCRFNNCLHTSEPGCAVIKAWEDGRIADSRYSSYLFMLDELRTRK